MKKLLLLVTLTFLVAGCSSAYKDAIEQGNKALEEQNFEDAIIAFNKALDEKPDDEDAKKLLKQAENEIKKIEEQKKKDEERKRKEEEKRKIEEAFLNSIDKSTVVGNAKIVAYQAFKDNYTDPNEIVKNIEFDESDKSLMITVKGKDNITDKLIGNGFYDGSTNIYRELSKDDRINEVWVTIVFPMQDVYGNVEDEEVMVTWMSKETMSKINWENFNYINLLDVVDGKRIYPHFVQ